MSGCDTTAAAQIRRRLADGREPHHAYLIAGGGVAARHELAAQLACAYVCRGGGDVRPCMACPDCRKASAGIHPDVSVLREGREVPVSAVRALRADAYIRPNEADRKVYLIDCTDGIHPSAQNALLKVLEEGPDYAAFVLETAVAETLLPTVRSRCAVLRLTGEADEADENSPVPATAAALADCLLKGEELALVEQAATLEKWKRGDLALLFAATARILLEGAEHRADKPACRRAAALAAHLQTLERACGSNVGTGHLTGYLTAGIAR